MRVSLCLMKRFVLWRGGGGVADFLLLNERVLSAIQAINDVSLNNIRTVAQYMLKNREMYCRRDFSCSGFRVRFRGNMPVDHLTQWTSFTSGI